MTISHPGAPNFIRLGELIQVLGKAIADLPHTGIVSLATSVFVQLAAASPLNVSIGFSPPKESYDSGSSGRDRLAYVASRLSIMADEERTRRDLLPHLPNRSGRSSDASRVPPAPYSLAVAILPADRYAIYL